MKITIETTNVSKEEIKVLVDYLENNSWKFEQEKKEEKEEKELYILREDSIHVIGSHGVDINKGIQRKELFEYQVIHRKSLLLELYMWISEAEKGGAGETAMKEDLSVLEDVTDDYIFSSISTNEFIYQGCSEFNSTCEELIELSESLK
jgi:hypothetical protein